MTPFSLPPALSAASPATSPPSSSPASPAAAPPALPALITADEDLAEEALRLAAVAGCELERFPDLGAELARAPLVLLDRSAVPAEPPPLLARSRWALLHRGPPDAELWRTAFELGAERTIELPARGDDLVDLLAEVVDGSAARTGSVLAVLGGCGGAGASVLAAATAAAAAERGDESLLVDCDPLGGGLDLALGTESASGLRWSGLAVSGGRVAAGALQQALPRSELGSGRLSVLACDREAEPAGLTADAVRAVVEAGRRSGQTVVCDLPRGLPEPAAAALRWADLVLVVVPAEVRACAAAAGIAARVSEVASGAVFAVVRGPAPAGLGVADVSAAVGLDVLATLRAQPALPAVLDRGGLCSASGRPRGPLLRTARGILSTMEELGEVAEHRTAVA